MNNPQYTDLMIFDEADFYAHPFAREQEQEEDEHPGQYFCGVCGWVPIEKFPHCH